jgi:ubiquinone/menaquinone biosynthesis C-methylase UbiE
LGILAKTVAEKYPDCKIFTLEISPEQIRQQPTKTDNLFLLQGDTHFMPYKNNIFDVIYCRYFLEHVSHPTAVLREIYHLIKPGGQFFIQENNISIHTFDPPCPYFDIVWKQFARLQKLLGGNAEIGKQLYALLKKSGFRNIRISIQPEVHAAGSKGFQDWVTNIIGNIRSGHKRLIEKGLTSQTEIDQALQELYILQNRDDAAAYFYWNRACAEK